MPTSRSQRTWRSSSGCWSERALRARGVEPARARAPRAQAHPPRFVAGGASAGSFRPIARLTGHAALSVLWILHRSAWTSSAARPASSSVVRPRSIQTSMRASRLWRSFPELHPRERGVLVGADPGGDPRRRRDRVRDGPGRGSSARGLTLGHTGSRRPFFRGPLPTGRCARCPTVELLSEGARLDPGDGMGLASFADGFSRVLRDKAQVEGMLPASTRYVEVDGVRGWLYPVSSELGDAFRLFVYFDGAGYQVRVVEPEVEGRFDPHACHVHPDGRICLSNEAGRGLASLQAAYARSVLWCNGFSVFLRDAQFPF